MSSVCIFTIVTRNRLHLTRVLMQSIKTAFPEAERHVLLIDAAEGLFDPAAEDFKITLARDLDLPRFHDFAFVNDAISLCCLLKPAFARHLLNHTTADVLIYADSDTLFYARPDGLLETLRTAPVVFTPHALAPLGEHAWRTDGDVMRSGAYNAGVFAARRCAEAETFLSWWLTAMSKERQIDATYCYDQQWLSLAVAYFPWISALHDPGCNVAYWNLPQRPLAADGTGRVTAGGSPLSVFHFSFFNPQTPNFLVNRPPTVVPAEQKLLRDLLHDYAARIANAGAEDCLRWSYGYSTFTDGKPIQFFHRRYFLDQAWNDSDHRGNPFEPTFSTRQCVGLKSVYRFDETLPRVLRRIRRWRA